MKSLTVQERTKLRSVVEMIECFKLQLIENGITRQQISDYFHQIINDAFHFSQNLSQKSDFNQTLTLILSHQNQSVLKTLRKLQVAFYMQRNDLQNEGLQDTIFRKTSEAISDKIKQKKKEIKQKRKKSTKQAKKNGQKNTGENPQFEKQISKFISVTKNDAQSFRSSNPLKESNNVSANIFAFNPFSTLKHPSQMKNLFTFSQQIDNKEDLPKSLFEINMLKHILQKKIQSEFAEKEKEQFFGSNGEHQLLDMAKLAFGR